MVMGEDGILRPDIIKPEILGKGGTIKPPNTGGGDGSDIAAFDTEEDDDEIDDPDGAESREALSNMLGLLGFPDLPATRTDLVAMAGRMTKLQNQLTQAIKDLEKESGGDPQAFAGAGDMAGPPDPAKATKIAAINDLQLQLQEAGQKLKDYAYQYFSTEATKDKKVLPLSQAQTLRAYEEGLIGGDLAKKKLIELGMSEEDVGILLKTSNKEMMDKKSGGGIDTETILEGYTTGVIPAGEAIMRLKKKGFTEQDIRLVMKIIDAKAKEKADKEAEKDKGKKKNTTTRTTTTTGNGGSKEVNVNVNVDTAALAREALQRARGR